MQISKNNPLPKQKPEAAATRSSTDFEKYSFLNRYKTRILTPIIKKILYFQAHAVKHNLETLITA